MDKENWWEKIISDFATVRTAITLGAFGVLYYLVLKGQPIPDLIVAVVNLLLGYWFGTRGSQASANGDLQTRKPPAQEAPKP